MKQNWSESELEELWSPADLERTLIDQRTEHGRLGFAILLKFFQLEGRFPVYHKEVPRVAVEFLAETLGLPVSAWDAFSFEARSAERTRARIRDFLGFRSATVADGEKLQDRLKQEIVPHDQEPSYLRAAVLDWCQEQRIEPPTDDRIDRLIGASVRNFENEFFTEIKVQLGLRALSCRWPRSGSGNQPQHCRYVP
jgi:hypothetical protein